MSNLRYKEGTEKVSKVLNKLRSLIVTLPDKEDTPKKCGFQIRFDSSSGRGISFHSLVNMMLGNHLSLKS